MVYLQILEMEISLVEKVQLYTWSVGPLIFEPNERDLVFKLLFVCET